MEMLETQSPRMQCSHLNLMLRSIRPGSLGYLRPESEMWDVRFRKSGDHYQPRVHPKWRPPA